MSHPTSISVPNSTPIITQYSEYISTWCHVCWSVWLPFTRARACQVLKPGTSRPKTALGKVSHGILTITIDVHEDPRGESKKSHDGLNWVEAQVGCLCYSTLALQPFLSRPLSVANLDDAQQHLEDASSCHSSALHALSSLQKVFVPVVARDTPPPNASYPRSFRPRCTPSRFLSKFRATLLRLSRHAPNIEPLTRVKSNPSDTLRLTLPCFLHSQSFAARCWWAQRSKILCSMRPLLPMGSYSLTYPYVTSNTPAFGRTATPARVRSPMHTDLGPRRDSAQVLRSRFRGTPWQPG